ncbi:Uncharacterized protein APZ42_023183 [Daphnia magna]|uniref:Uncharacterized protein n=1 Tax=Daphnia magna TaxID=35525 RepID=A0A164V638_9CRUS|nr:Uncharacterized protein APZ42_023183 [Daphnia magna]
MLWTMVELPPCSRLLAFEPQLEQKLTVDAKTLVEFNQIGTKTRLIETQPPFWSTKSTPPAPQPRRRPQPQEEMIIDILQDLSSVTAMMRRPHERDGRRKKTFAEPNESTMEEPTEPFYKIHEKETNKGLHKLTDGLEFCFSKKAISKKTYTWRCVTPDHLETHGKRSRNQTDKDLEKFTTTKIFSRLFLFLIAVSDNIRSPAEDSVYRLFERALENNNLHSLWVGLDRVVPREVFRRLGLREPFPRPTSALTKPKTTPTARFTPYARPADQNLKFLNEKERAELEAVQKVKKEHTLAILIAQRKEKEAAETALYLQQTCLLRREKEALEQREVELAKSSAARRLAAKTSEPYIPSPIVRPAVLQIQALPDIPSQPEPSTSAPDAQLVTPARSSKSAKSSKSRSSSTRSRKEAPGETPRSSKEGRGRTSSSEMVLAKKFKKPSINTSDDEEAVLKSPISPYST